MTTYKRGDVVLVRVPRSQGMEDMLRPAVVLHPGLDTDLGISLLPLVPPESASSLALPIESGSYESARMGLVSTLALDPDIALDLPRALLFRTLGRCPYELLNEVIRRRRSLLASASRDSEEVPPAAPPLKLHVHEPEEEADAESLPAGNNPTEQGNDGAQVGDARATEEPVTQPMAMRDREDFADRFPVERARYTCLRTPQPISINGDLTKAVWRAAPVSNAFVDIISGKPAWFDTRVRLLWDDEHLYFGFTAEETDVWGTLTERDSKIYEENDLEIFIAGRDAYYEFEISACNVIYEVLWIWKDIHQPGGPYWGQVEFNPATQRTLTLDGVGGHIHPRGERWGFLDWDCPGLRHAVKVDGTLNQRDDVDRGWSAEIAIPWSSLELLADGRQLPPRSGDVWRIDCSRFQKIDQAGETIDPCAGWTWNQHRHYDSHIPEVFPYITFSDEEVQVEPEGEGD